MFGGATGDMGSSDDDFLDPPAGKRGILRASGVETSAVPNPQPVPAIFRVPARPKRQPLVTAASSDGQSGKCCVCHESEPKRSA